MKKGRFKISYIKKPFAKKSIPALTASALALFLCGVSLGLSVQKQGQGGLNVAAWALSSMVFSVVALVYSFRSFREVEVNDILARISMAVSGLLFIFWICIVIVGVTG